MRAKISADGMNAIYLDIKAFLEGVEVPLSGVELSYGVNEVPQATINIPASAVVRDLPEICKLHVFFKDLIPDPQTGEARWRLLFDGELIGYGYNTNPSGASISISAIHAASYMSLMQIIGLDVSGLINNPTANSSIAGNATLVSTLGINRVDSSVIRSLEKNRTKVKNVADIVYLLIKTTLTETKKSSVGAYFAKKLGNDAGGLKILKRIFGVTPEAEKVTKTDLEVPVIIETPSTQQGGVQYSNPRATDMASPAGAPRTATVGNLQIVDTRLQFDPQKPLETRSATNYLVVHHCGGENRDHGSNEIHQFHLTQNYAGIGYHFLIRKNGSIEQGRPLNTIGAHTHMRNSDTVGISLSGSYMKAEATVEQYAALTKLLKELCVMYDLNPADAIRGHKDLYSETECPGDTVYARLPQVRDNVSNEMNNFDHPVIDTGVKAGTKKEDDDRGDYTNSANDANRNYPGANPYFWNLALAASDNLFNATQKRLSPTLIYCQWMHESGNFQKGTVNPPMYNIAGITGCPTRTQDAVGHNYYDSYEDFVFSDNYGYVQQMRRSFPKALDATTIESFAMLLKEDGYFTDSPTNYINGMRSMYKVLTGKEAPPNSYVGGGGGGAASGDNTVSVSVTGAIIDFASFITSLAFFKRMKELYDQSSTRSLHDFVLDFITRFYHNITYVPTLPNNKAILVKPEVLFVDPPHCNVIFPTMRTSGSTSRAFKKEPTRTMLVSNPIELVGGSSQTLTNLVTIVYMDYDAAGKEIVSPLKTITGDNVKQPTTFISKFEAKNGVRISQVSAGSDIFLFLQSGYASASGQSGTTASGTGTTSSGTGAGVNSGGGVSKPAVDKNSFGGKILAGGEAHMGKPWSASPDGVTNTDCSLLVQHAYGSAGVTLRRTADLQYYDCRDNKNGSLVTTGGAANWDICQPGDMVFFKMSGTNDEVGHVGIYAGKDVSTGAPIMLHAGVSSGVSYAPINDYWLKQNTLVGVGRMNPPGTPTGTTPTPAAPAVVPKDFQQSRRVSTGSDGKKKVNYVMKLSTAALQGVAKTLENLAGYMLIRERYQSRAGGYSTVFNPYVVPSFPLYNIESADPSSLGVSGYITRVSHSLNPSGCSTSVSYSFGHIQTEAKPKVFPVVEEEYVSKIEETYTKLFDVEKSKTESIDAERKWYGEEPRTLTQTYERLWRPLTSIDEYLKDIADGATIVNEETAQRAMYIWFSGSFFDVKTQDVIKKYTESILAGRAITLTDIS